MGNNLRKTNRCQQNTQETPWNLRFQNTKQRTPRFWGHHTPEGCFCFPWKKACTSKAGQGSAKGNKRVTSAPIQQGNANQTPAEELCYVFINHSALSRQLSGNSAEEYYENISYKAERPRECLGGTETEYALVHVPSTPRHPPHSEGEYDLLMPSKISRSSTAIAMHSPLCDSTLPCSNEMTGLEFVRHPQIKVKNGDFV